MAPQYLTMIGSLNSACLVENLVVHLNLQVEEPMFQVAYSLRAGEIEQLLILPLRNNHVDHH